jgi:hypothetical protein
MVGVPRMQRRSRTSRNCSALHQVAPITRLDTLPTPRHLLALLDASCPEGAGLAPQAP